MKRILTYACICAVLICCGLGCTAQETETLSQPDIDEEVTLVLTGGWVDSVAIESIAHEFHTKYPACTIVYEYLQNYEESLLTRLEDGTGSIDIFLTNNLQEGTKLQPYALELFSQSDALDLSNIHDGLIKNFTYQNSDKDAPPEIYAVPVGAEMRGMFVNKTLLASLNIDVPANLEEFLAACEALKENGYVPIQANPSFAGQHLLYPYICNLIANAEQYEATYARVNSCEEGVSELFREPMQVLYTLMAERYYNYKFVETELGVFTNMSSDATAKAFLNIKMDADGNEYKADDLGTVAFMPSAMSLSETIAKVHADYHSEIAYEFVLAPVSDEGGFAYMSPATGIAVNRNSAHQDWAVRFLNFLFEPDNNREYAKKAGIIPCTKDALTYITERFDVPDDRISQLGQVSFDYQFYNLMSASLVEISKGNNPKYMDTDEDGNPVLFDFEYYMSKLEERFADQRAEDEAVSG